MVPVCTSEQQALDFIGNLQSRTYRYSEVLFSKLQTLFEGENVRFILEPKSEIKVVFCFSKRAKIGKFLPNNFAFC